MRAIKVIAAITFGKLSSIPRTINEYLSDKIHLALVSKTHNLCWGCWAVYSDSRSEVWLRAGGPGGLSIKLSFSEFRNFIDELLFSLDNKIEFDQNIDNCRILISINNENCKIKFYAIYWKIQIIHLYTTEKLEKFKSNISDLRNKIGKISNLI